MLAIAAIVLDAIRALRDHVTTKSAEVTTAVNAKGIKSVQRGVSTSSGTFTIAAVNLTKSFIVASATTAEKPSTLNGSMGIGYVGSARLISATQVSVETHTGRVCWEVVEFQ